jgi:hypothetical protein
MRKGAERTQALLIIIMVSHKSFVSNIRANLGFFSPNIYETQSG